MKSITESLLDVEDNIQSSNSDLDQIATITWLEEHGIKLDLKHLLKIKSPAVPSHNHGWYLHDISGSQTLILKKGDRWPDYVNNISYIDNIKLIGYDGVDIPTQIKDISVDYSFIIRDCPRLRSLVGCPESTRKFAVSGCPKLNDIKGCPRDVQDLFKFINNGTKVDYKTIKKYCKVDKNNVIY